jgi:hypothetical protein
VLSVREKNELTNFQKIDSRDVLAYRTNSRNLLQV